MAVKIYTRSGDKGMTSLVGGTRVSKSDPRLESYGTVDELNSILGMARAELRQLDLAGAKPGLHLLAEQLEKIQNRLFNLGSLLACEDARMKSRLPVISEAHISELEQHIDVMTEQLPELKEFILPGGHKLAATLHFGRTVCRRAERLTIFLYDDRQIEDPLLLHFLNRLSDYLFVAARFANFLTGISDIKWQKD